MATPGINYIDIGSNSQIQADIILSIQRLIRLSQFKDAQIDEKRLSWEVIRTILSEMRESRNSPNDLLKAVSGLMPQVNVQVNVDGERKKLEYKAENAMTERLRNVARTQLAKLDAAAGRLQQQTHQTITADSSTAPRAIEAAEKVET